MNISQFTGTHAMKPTRRLFGWTLIVVTLLVGVGLASAAGIPPLINYQGKLTTPAGAPCRTVRIAVILSIYDVPTSGTPLWTEAWPALQTFSGEFSVMMGSATAIPSTFFSDHTTTYLGIKVGSDADDAAPADRRRRVCLPRRQQPGQRHTLRWNHHVERRSESNPCGIGIVRRRRWDAGFARSLHSWGWSQYTCGWWWAWPQAHAFLANRSVH